MKYYILFAPLLLVLACGKAPKPKQVDTDEYAVINLAFKQITFPDSSYKSNLLYVSGTLFYPPTVTKKEIAEGKRKQKLYADSLRKVLDTAKIYLFVNDSLSKFPVHYIRAVFHDKNRLTIHAGDTLKKIMQIVLSIDTSSKAERLDCQLIKPLYHYQMVFFHGRSPRTRTQFSPGDVSISRPCFNMQKTVACVYAESYTGPLNAAGVLIYLVKDHGKWSVLKSVNIWVA